MSYCTVCGTKLVLRECKEEGLIPYCETCKAFRYPTFNVAIIAVVMDPEMKKTLLIQQYGKRDNILVAGYVNKGESAEDALKREIKEELGREVLSFVYLKSEYFKKTNSLMCGYICKVDSDDLSHINHEVDRAAWFSREQALEKIKDDSLAEKMLRMALKQAALYKNHSFLRIFIILNMSGTALNTGKSRRAMMVPPMP